MARLTTQELEAIRERIESIWFDEAYVKGDPWKGYEVRCVATGQTIAETTAEIDAEFIANAREDIPKLLAEVERLRMAFDQLNDNRTKWMESHGELEVENARLQVELKEAESIALWSTRRLPKVYKTFAYDAIDELFGGKAERL